MASPATRSFTAREFDRMIELGIIAEDENVELLDGELVLLNPQGPTHASLTVQVHRLLERNFGGGVHLRDHSPIDAGKKSRPEPDLAVVRGEPEAFLRRHPKASEVALVVEIASKDRRPDRRKVAIYAEAGVPVYWVLDLKARRLEDRRDPQPDGVYARVRLLGPDDEVDVPETDRRVAVSTLLP